MAHLGELVKRLHAQRFEGVLLEGVFALALVRLATDYGRIEVREVRTLAVDLHEHEEGLHLLDLRSLVEVDHVVEGENARPDAQNLVQQLRKLNLDGHEVDGNAICKGQLLMRQAQLTPNLAQALLLLRGPVTLRLWCFGRCADTPLLFVLW